MNLVRRRIALWFIALSSVVYVIPTFLGFFYFYKSLTDALDLELQAVAASLGHAIRLQNGKPRFRDWTRIVQTDPPHSLCSIQLYDADGKLIEHNVAPAIYQLSRDQKEITDGTQRMRVWSGPITVNGMLIGYQEIQVSTRQRDLAMQQFALTMAVIAPVILIGLGACSYFVAQKATVPIQATVDMLRQFMADAGHELTTPLTIIEASADALGRTLEKHGITAVEPEVIAASAERMSNILDNLTTLTQLEAPHEVQVERRSISVRRVLSFCLESFLLKFEQKGVQLCGELVERVRASQNDLARASQQDDQRIVGNSISNNDVLVNADEDQLFTVFSNLLENALRYTNSGGQVEVSLAAASDHVVITFSDNGIGIPEPNLPRIFDRFYRVDKSRSRDSGGSGLGLAIVKAVIDSHGGSVVVKSIAGSGTQFTITLPAHLGVRPL